MLEDVGGDDDVERLAPGAGKAAHDVVEDRVVEERRALPGRLRVELDPREVAAVGRIRRARCPAPKPTSRTERESPSAATRPRRTACEEPGISFHG
jgi:hypothetical protein